MKLTLIVFNTSPVLFMNVMTALYCVLTLNCVPAVALLIWNATNFASLSVVTAVALSLTSVVNTGLIP